MLAVINDCQIYYEVHGKEDGKALFFIHGGPGVGDCRKDIETFSSLGEKYKLVFIDMRGSGRSEDKPPYTHEQWAADIDGLREHLGIEKIMIHGCSYGGFLSQEYVLRYSERVTHVILNVTAANNKHQNLAIENALQRNLPGVDIELLKRLFNGEVRSNEDFKEIFLAILPLYAMNFDQDQARQRIDSIFYHYETHNYAFKYNLAKFDLTNRLQEISVPVLVTGGRHDWITPAIYSEEIAKKIPNSTLVIFEENGHSLIREEPERYMEVLTDFLSKEEKICTSK